MHVASIAARKTSEIELLPRTRPAIHRREKRRRSRFARGVSSTRFDVTVVGVRKTVRTSLGLTVPGSARRRSALLIASWCPRSASRCPRRCERALAGPDVRDAAVLLRQWADAGSADDRGLHRNVRAAPNPACSTIRMRPPPGGWLRSFDRAIPTVRLDESHMLVKSDGSSPPGRR